MFNYFRITYCVTAEYQKKKNSHNQSLKNAPRNIKTYFFVIFKKTFYFLVICKTFIHSYIKLNFYKCEKSTWVLMKCLLKNRFILKKKFSLTYILKTLNLCCARKSRQQKIHCKVNYMFFFIFNSKDWTFFFAS